MLFRSKLSNGDVVDRLDHSKYFGITRVNKQEIKWSNLEEGLNLDYKAYIHDYLALFNRKRNKPGIPISIDEINEFNEFEKNEFKTCVHEFTKRYFEEWISNMYFDSIEHIKTSYNGDLFNIIEKQDYFLTFNYTTSLEDIFNIDGDNIMYIHNRFPISYKEKQNGKKVKFDMDKQWEYEMRESIGYFQFGSVQNLSIDIQEYVKTLNIKINNDIFNIVEFIDNLEIFCRELSKDIHSNYDNLRMFLRNKDIDEVIILGHSFMGIDLPYYDDVILPLLNDCKWTIYWYSDKDYEDILNFEKRYSCTVEKFKW